MQKLSEKEFSYYKGWIKESKEEHDKKMKDVNIPEAVIKMYQGLLEDKEVYENYLLIAVQTLLPTLFYQFPRPIIKRKTGRGSDYSASVIEGVVKHYINDDWKIENQLCILDAYLAYGYGVMKVAYNSRRGFVKKPNIFTGKTESAGNDNVEEEEYIKFEHPTLQRVSPKDVYLDHTKPFHHGQRITFNYKRTLQELIDSNIYGLPSEFINYFKGRGDGDARKVKLDLHEHFCILESGVYKLCYVDEWDEPIFWDKTSYKGLPVSLLRFNKTPDELYSISTGKLAYNAQKELDYLNEIWKQHVDHIRRQHLVDQNALTEPGKKVLEMNEIDGIIYTDRPVTAGVYAQIGSNPMGKDVYANIENVRNYLKLLLSTTGGRGGGADVEFAETEKQQAQGDFMRMSGLQDNIRDFVRKQLRLTVSNVYYLGSPEMTIKITGKDVIDPKTGEIISGKYLQLGGENGLAFQEEVGGDVESDYLYDVDITSTSRPDFAIIRKQLSEALMLLQTLRPAINEKGKDVDIATLAQDYLNTFDALPDPEKYFVDLTPEQMAMIQQSKMIAQTMAQGGKKPAQGVPNEPAMEAGIKNQAMGVAI